MTSPIAIVVHGGAGTINRSRMTDLVESAYRSKLMEAVEAGYAVLKQGGSSRNAVLDTVVILEDSELFNAGHGSVLNNLGAVEMDDSIMDGWNVSARAVAGLRQVKNPILLADKVLSESPHVMLLGEGAEEFAVKQGLHWWITTILKQSYEPNS